MGDSIYQGTDYVPKPIPTFKSETMPLTYKIILWVLVLVVIALIILICILWDKVDDTKSTIKEINAPTYTLMQEDLDKKLVLTSNSKTDIILKDISGWKGNIVIQPMYKSPAAPLQTHLHINTEYEFFITELNDGVTSYDKMPINGDVHIESGDATSSTFTLKLVTYYLNMGFINNKVYIQGLAGIRIT